MRISNQFLFQEKNRLKDFKTEYEHSLSKKEVALELEKARLALAKLQDKMYAHNRYSVLLCFQGMDVAGKDSLIREVFKDFNARGVVVHSFKAPNSKELQHDFLWRHNCALPEKGKFAVFNRSHYENVLVTRVNPHFLLNERMPNALAPEDANAEFWENRFESIKDFEKHCARNGVIVMKIYYLHLSKTEQKNRLLRRIDQGKHNWKFDPSDIRDRALWDEYSACYEEVFQKTSFAHAPWYVVPADDKNKCRMLVAQILLEQLSQYKDMHYPEPKAEIMEKLHEYRDILTKEV